MNMPGFNAEASLQRLVVTYKTTGGLDQPGPGAYAGSVFPQLSCLQRQVSCRRFGGYWIPCPVSPCYHCCAIP